MWRIKNADRGSYRNMVAAVSAKKRSVAVMVGLCRGNALILAEDLARETDEVDLLINVEIHRKAVIRHERLAGVV